MKNYRLMIFLGVVFLVLVLTISVGNWMSSHVETLQISNPQLIVDIPSGTIHRSEVSKMYSKPPVINPTHDPLAPVKKVSVTPQEIPRKTTSVIKPHYEAPISDPILVQ